MHKRHCLVEALSPLLTCRAKTFKTSTWYTYSSIEVLAFLSPCNTVAPLSLPTFLLRNAAPSQLPVFEKKLFSMCTEEVLTHLDGLASKPTDVVLFGIEAHVCITQVRKKPSPGLALSLGLSFFVVPTAVGEVLLAAAGIFSSYSKFLAYPHMLFAPCRVLSYPCGALSRRKWPCSLFTCADLDAVKC